MLLQERMLLEDMLYVLLGIDGRFVEYHEVCSRTTMPQFAVRNFLCRLSLFLDLLVENAVL